MKRLAHALLLGFALGAPPPVFGAADAPRLVLVIAVDQLRRDRLDAELPGGLGRLAREGRVYTEAALDHALTETCPGHATMLTGRHPGAAGVPGNRFIDAEAGRRIYCVEDPADDARVLGGEQGRSPRALRVTALGDWLREARPGTRVFSISGKDRAAITLGGKRPDAAYWLEREGALGFTTSRYYREALPDWVEAWNTRMLEPLPKAWKHEFDEGAPRIDDYVGEAERFSRTTPHPLAHEQRRDFLEHVYYSPYLDELTLNFASELVRREQLGQGDGPDLLALGLSATDLVGHLYGPGSREARDALVRLDRALGAFLADLEQRLGAGQVLVVLTADHGVLPLPEWLAEEGQSLCPVEGGRVALTSVGLWLNWDLHRRFTWIVTTPKDWLLFAGSQLAVNRPVAEAQGIDPAEVAAATERHLESLPAVAEVWTPEELAQDEGAWARLYRNSRDPERSGDLIVQLEPTCLLSPYDAGTSHGSPYGYDRAVPLLFWGDGIEPARVPGPAATIDIAPTLARRLGLVPPTKLDGRVLFE
jgi:arylsulfatase A-like enzyme